MNDDLVGYLLTQSGPLGVVIAVGITILSGAAVLGYRLLSQVIERGVEIRIPPKRR